VHTPTDVYVRVAALTFRLGVLTLQHVVGKGGLVLKPGLLEGLGVVAALARSGASGRGSELPSVRILVASRTVHGHGPIADRAMRHLRSVAAVAGHLGVLPGERETAVPVVTELEGME
jgi:hypothetical protein